MKLGNKKLILILVVIKLLLVPICALYSMPLPEGWNKLDDDIDFSKIPNPKKDITLFVYHASTAAISFPGKKISYICNRNFIARGSSYNGNLGIPCRTRREQANAPRLHSEISFLQYITNNDDPVRDGIKGILEQMLKDYPNERIVIFIKNTDFLPCTTIEDDKVPCIDYLLSFRDVIGIEKCSIIIYAIQYRKIKKLDFNKRKWIEE